MAIFNPNKKKQTQTSLFGGASGPAPVNPAPSYSFQGGHLVNGNAAPVVAPTGSSFVDPNLSYGANVVHAGAAASGGSTGGTTDEVVVIGNPNVNNSTFNNITESPSPTYAQFSGEGTGEGTVTPPVETPPTETETPPTDTSGSEGGGTSTPADTTIDSYYDYLRTEMPEHLKGIYNDTIEAIDQANAKIIAEINVAKERGIVDANTSYQHNLSTYGAKNEALASMGLAGSGYSEYLDSQAYAAQRGEVQGVKASALAAENNANATADAQKLEAKTALDENLLYYDNLAEQHLEGKWSDILTGAGNGTYSKEQVENLAKHYGFSDEQIATLTGAVDSYEAEKAETEAEAEKAYADEMFGVLLGGANTGGYNADQLASLADTYGLSPEQKQALIDSAAAYEQKKEKAKTTDSSVNYKDVIANSQYDPSYYTQEDFDDMVKNDVLTADDAAKAKAEQNRNVYNGVVDMLNSGNVDNIAGAFADADALYRDGNIDKATYDEITALLNNSSQGVTYQYKSGKLTASQYVEKMKAIGAASSGTVSGGWTIQGLGTGRNNDDVDITIGSTSRGGGLGEFDLLCGDAITDSATISALNKLATGDANKAPITEGTWFTWLHGDTANSADTPGKLVVYNGGLYLYGTYGWAPLKNDNDNSSLDKCIAAFLQSTSRSDIPGKSK